MRIRVYFMTKMMYHQSDAMTKEEEWSMSYLQRRNAELEIENAVLRKKLNDFSLIERTNEFDRE